MFMCFLPVCDEKGWAKISHKTQQKKKIPKKHILQHPCIQRQEDSWSTHSWHSNSNNNEIRSCAVLNIMNINPNLKHEDSHNNIRIGSSRLNLSAHSFHSTLYPFLPYSQVIDSTGLALYKNLCLRGYIRRWREKGNKQGLHKRYTKLH